MSIQNAALRCDGTTARAVRADFSWPVSAVHTFFYYDDLPAALHFYEQVLGFAKAADFGSCAIFQLHGNAYLGLVNATHGSQRPIQDANKGAVLSLLTHDLEACLARAKRAGVLSAAAAPVPGCDGRTREFRICDPGGYTIEFFSWNADAAPAKCPAPCSVVERAQPWNSMFFSIFSRTLTSAWISLRLMLRKAISW
jgi:predicted enzyme related to lactoylglutathione lyase